MKKILKAAVTAVFLFSGKAIVEHEVPEPIVKGGGYEIDMRTVSSEAYDKPITQSEGYQFIADMTNEYLKHSGGSICDVEPLMLQPLAKAAMSEFFPSIVEKLNNPVDVPFSTGLVLSDIGVLDWENGHFIAQLTLKDMAANAFEKRLDFVEEVSKSSDLIDKAIPFVAAKLGVTQKYSCGLGV